MTRPSIDFAALVERIRRLPIDMQEHLARQVNYLEELDRVANREHVVPRSSDVWASTFTTDKTVGGNQEDERRKDK